jgi:subtilisin family serine protease
VAAAGNLAGDTAMSIPAGYNLPSQGSVVAVGATTITDNLASFSNNGAGNTIEAPGVNIVSAGTDAPDSYNTGSGTSFGAPAVSGVTSLHNSRRPSIWDQIFPFDRFARNNINKLLSDSVNVIRSLPNSQTTARLLQVNGNPIITTEVLSPILPQASPPAFVSTSDAQSGKMDFGAAAFIVLISLALTFFVLAINDHF